MHETGKSYTSIVAKKPANNAGVQVPSGGVGGAKGGTRGELVSAPQLRAQHRIRWPDGRERVRQDRSLDRLTAGRNPVREFRTPGSVRGGRG